MSTPKNKLMFVIPSLEGGGAEKVLVDIISNLNSSKYRIMLVLFNAKGVLLEEIPPNIEIYDLKKRSKYSFLILIIKLASLIRKLKPDNLVGFMHYVNMITILAYKLSGSKSNIVATIHTNIIEVISRNWLGPVKYILYKQTFKHANHVIVPSEGIKKMMMSDFKITKNKIKTIPHPLLVEKITQLSNEKMDPAFSNKKYILSVGRLTEAKGYTYLLNAFKIISEKNNINLVILGVGENLKMLTDLSEELGLRDRIFFAGFQKNPYKFMKNASLFVLSSLWESFAVVLCEAMLCNVPIVSTDCPSGPGELINNEVNGLLVKTRDAASLANAMDRVLSNENDAEKFSKEGLKKAYSLNIDNIIPLYEKLFV